MLIILDCNIWLSFALYKNTEYLEQLYLNHNIELATCKELIDEIQGVSSREKFRKYFSYEYAEKLIALHVSISKQFNLHNIIEVVSDKKDNDLFALCNVSTADYFVTGDKLLLAVGIYNQTKVISLAAFKAIAETL